MNPTLFNDEDIDDITDTDIEIMHKHDEEMSKSWNPGLPECMGGVKIAENSPEGIKCKEFLSLLGPYVKQEDEKWRQDNFKKVLTEIVFSDEVLFLSEFKKSEKDSEENKIISEEDQIVFDIKGSFDDKIILTPEKGPREEFSVDSIISEIGRTEGTKLFVNIYAFLLGIYSFNDKRITIYTKTIEILAAIRNNREMLYYSTLAHEFMHAVYSYNKIMDNHSNAGTIYDVEETMAEFGALTVLEQFKINNPEGFNSINWNDIFDAALSNIMNKCNTPQLKHYGRGACLYGLITSFNSDKEAIIKEYKSGKKFIRLYISDSRNSSHKLKIDLGEGCHHVKFIVDYLYEKS